MDAQMKRGFLEACVLAVLSRGESYGYQIIKDVPATLGLTESTLYPLLKRLEGANCIAVRSAEHNGRLRKYYRITKEGRARVAAFMAEWNEVEALYRFVREAAEGESSAREAVPCDGDREAAVSDGDARAAEVAPVAAAESPERNTAAAGARTSKDGAPRTQSRKPQGAAS